MGCYTPEVKAMMQNINEELADIPNDNMSATSPPEESAMIVDDNDQPESARTEHNGPIHDRRCVYEQINPAFEPLNKREMYFRIAHPYELLPLSNYYQREWSEVEHIFLPAINFAQEIYGRRSPCRSPTPTSMGL